MKGKIIGSTFLLSAAIIALSSYKDGPAHGGLGNRTGSSGSSNSCSMGCHGPESSALSLSLTLTDLATGENITDAQYEPGRTYIVKLVGNYSGSASYSHLGFQASVVNSTGIDCGFIEAMSSSTDIVAVSGLTLIEHINPIPKTGTSYEVSFKWTAPSTGSGTADFYARMVVNNNNGISSDDTPNKIKVSFTEGSETSLETPDLHAGIKVYPNPCSDLLNIVVDDAATTDYRFSIRDMNSSELLSQTYANSNKGFNYKLDIGGIVPGIYIIEIATTNYRESRIFVKQ